MKESKKGKWLRYGILVFVFVLLVAILVGTLFLPQIPDDLNKIALSNPTTIYSASGQIVQVLANREVVQFDQISPYLVKAILALEDTDFYKHHGFSKKAFLRAFINNIIHLQIREGGSTITQQLAKNLFFSFSRSPLRKLKEFFIALQIEQQFTKQQILEAYLNQIDFGSGVYGIELAAQIYFAKHADELTLAEAAMLAGIPRWAARYNPYKNPDIARQRQKFVLKRMQEEGFITEKERKQALDEKLRFGRMNKMVGHANYFTQYIRKLASQKYGRDVVNYGGLQITTTLDSRLQYDASVAVRDGLKALDDLMGLSPYDEATWEEKLSYPQAALVAIDVKSGAVVAMVGGRDYARSQFNRAISRNRSAGSAFKPFIYFAALDKGIVKPNSVLIDEPIEFKNGNQVWKPENFENQYLGPVTVKWALMNSINVIAAKLIERVTPEAVVSYARRFGIEAELRPNLSLALGATGVSPMDMATGYNTFANEGIRRKPFLVKEIRTSGNTLLEKSELDAKRVADAQTVYILIDMLKGVVRNGTGKSVRRLGFLRPCAGKTGTTNDYRDAWFVGFTPELVTAVWVGFDDNRKMFDKFGHGITGAKAAIPIWTRFMKAALANTPYSDFPIPPGIEFQTVDPRTGSGPMPGQPSITVALRTGGLN